MARPGPKPTCACGRCQTCRRRESARRHYYCEPPLNPKRFRSATYTPPTDPATVGYLAGLLDGEGYIGKQNGRWRVQIAMTDQPVIDWLGSMGGVAKERGVTGNRQRCWVWLLMRQVDVHAFLATVEPLLRVKQDRAALALAEIRAEGIGTGELLSLERAT